MYKGVVGRPQFGILPLHAALLFPQRVKQHLQAFGPLDERLAMIGEGEGNDTIARQPALDTAKYDSVLQLFARSRGGHDARLITISPPQRFQPPPRVEHRGLRVPVEKLLPTGILYRIKMVDWHLNTFKARVGSAE
jgi:hypothetical protein